MKRKLFFILLFTVGTLFAQIPSADEILDKIDENYTAETKIISSKMIVHGRRNSRTITSKSWIRGSDEAFTEYLSPAREKGTKMLKLEDQLWTYSPSTDRIIRISGHMLRQSVMGSDLSYEDMMEDSKLREHYDAEVVGEDTMLDRPCWVMSLTANSKDVAYFSRKIWVDKDRYLMYKEERFAKSGKLLKTTEVKSFTCQNERWVAEHLIFKDVLKKGKGTEFILDNVEFNPLIPAYIFTKSVLKR